jgi:hypothetical protein
MDKDISQNILKALLLICKRLDQISDSLLNIASSLQTQAPNPKQEEIN